MTDSTDRPEEGPSDIAGPQHEGTAHAGTPENPWAAPTRPVEEAPTAPVAAPAEPPAAENDASASRAPEKRRGLVVPVVAAAVVAALIGGGAGAGIALAVAPHEQTAAVTSSTGGSNVTINNAKSATVISAVAAKASPSVVTISVSATNESGTGSGVVLSSDGYVLTNNHVVTLDGDSSSGTISVTTSDGHIYKATIVGTDPVNDLAVIRLTGASGLTPATFGDSSRLNVGDTAIAIGAPLDLPGTVTTGIVSALNRSISIQSSAVPNNGGGGDTGGGDGSGPFNFWNFGNGNGNGNGNGFGNGGGNGGGSTSTSTISLAVIQTDAAINPGNSGGPLLDAQGRVIGINVAIASTGSGSGTSGQSGSIGVGFAIPGNVAKRIAGELIQDKKATHGLLGATVADASSASSSTVAGALVKSVTNGGAAAKAGIKAGDVITRFNGVTIQSATDLTAQVRAVAGGASAPVVYVRDGSSHTVTVTLGTYTG